MSIWSRIYGGITGGWKTHGPNAPEGDGAWATSEEALYEQVGQRRAMNIGAVLACMEKRAETLASLPLHLRDAKKNVINDHDLYSVLHDSPNMLQTAPEYWSQGTALTDLHGNAYSLVTRRSNKSVISLEPFFDPYTTVELKRNDRGMYFYLVGGTEKYDVESILHLRGFSMDGLSGLSRLEAARMIISAQLSADTYAQKAFKQGMKVGGFFEPDKGLQPMTPLQSEAFAEKLNSYGRAENAGKWLALPPGFTAKGGSQYRMNPADAELLASRYFGIEEICRVFNVPPQLIGHSDKASSWASSIENINLFFLMYSMAPTLVRDERRISKTLLSTTDKAKGIEPKFMLHGLMRGDLQTRMAFYASGLQNGYLSRNEVRDLEERTAIQGGDEYTVQLNMGALADTGKTPPAKPAPVPAAPTKSDVVNLTVNMPNEKRKGFSLVRDVHGNATAVPLE